MGVRRLLLPFVWTVGVAVGSLVAPTFAAFSGTTGNTGNALSADPDWVAPTVTATVIRKAAGGVGGYIKQGGSYYVYASVTESGNPPSGVSSVTADMSAITSGQTAVALSAGSFTVDGVSYGYRSALLTANAVLVGGSHAYTTRAIDAAGNTRTQSGFSVTVDNVIPAGSDVQTQDAGGTQGRPELGDKIMYTYTERIDPESVVAGWSGDTTNVTVRIVQNANNDLVQIWDTSNSTQLPLGEINTQGDYVTSDATFGASGTRSTMVQSNGVITVTLGSLNSGNIKTNGNDAQLWTPSSAVTDLAGNNCDISVVTELGVLDPDF